MLTQLLCYTKANNWKHKFSQTKKENMKKDVQSYACFITSDLAFRLRKIALKLEIKVSW